jgi:membrane protein implicated in regulation of membrane protease activity
MNGPYIGLAPYTEEDAQLFFGRDAERDLVIANVMAARFTVVYGSSGVGKSSLLRAGVAHGLREAARMNLGSSGTPQLAVTVFSAWRDDPVPAIVRSVKHAVADAWQSTRYASEPGEEHLDDVLRRGAESVDGECIVILDQFEDYFQYHDAELETGSFVREFVRAISNEAVRASFLISIREDALAKLDCFEGRIPHLFSNLLRIDHLDRDAARRAIEAPLEHMPPTRIEPSLVESVLDQVRLGRLTMGEVDRISPAQHQLDRIEAPYLQLVMKRVWEAELAETPANGEITLRLSTLDRLGGAEQIVHTHLDTTMDELTARERNIAARIFAYLVTPSGTKIGHSAADLAAYASVDPTELEPVLTRLSAARILQPLAPSSTGGRATRYQIFHDLLAAAVLDWRQRFLRDAERDIAGRQLMLERHRVWHLRRRVISLSVLLVAVVVLGAVGLATNAQDVAFSREASQRLDSLFLACFLFGALFTFASAVLGSHAVGGHGLHAGHHLATFSHTTGSSPRRIKLPLVNPSALLAFLTWFGAAGYLLEHFAGWVLGAVLVGALAAGALGWVMISRFLDLVISGEREMNPEDYRLEGTIGRVTVAIPAGGTGEVVFTKGGVRRSEAARAVRDPIPRGTEVMITHYANGFATVEPWAALLDET